MRQQLLLLEDVDALGKKGEVVSAKSGYVRNFLLPRGFAVVATQNMLRRQERLQAEREKQAVIDRKESEELAAKIQGLTLETKVKVDPEGHMYGSVSAQDIVQLFQEKGFAIERKYVQLTKPIKVTGTHQISLKLKEGIVVTCSLAILAEGVIAAGIEAVTAPIVNDNSTESKSIEA